MNKNLFKSSILMGLTGLLLISTVQASTPVWTFAQILGYPSSVTVNTTGTATIKYTVTNQSHKSHTLQMKSIQGITPSGCTSPLGYLQSCTLNLNLNGSLLTGDVVGGPVLCEQTNLLQCYQPSQTDRLAIGLIKQSPVQQYTVTAFADANGSVNPSNSQTVNSGATITFSAIPNPGYGVTQWFIDGNLAQTGGAIYQLTNITANHTISVSFGTVTLSPNISTLSLSVNCPSASISGACAQKNDALTGNARQITITNTGSGDATNVSVGTSGLPSDTLASPSSCGTIPANGGTCVVNVIPGEIASSNANNILCTSGVQPAEGSVDITADGGLSVTVGAYVLSYGCIYQGGFIYSMDDTTPDTGSVGGKITATTDTYPGQTSPAGNAIPNWGGFGVDIGPNLYETSVQGANDGSANSADIISVLSPRPLPDYAAGLCSTLSVDTSGTASCTAPTTCYTSWYLPALCELGPFGAICTTGSTNIQQQLFESMLIPSAILGLVDTGNYWSSTQYSVTPRGPAWGERFVSGNNSIQLRFNKREQVGIRCSRALTL